MKVYGSKVAQKTYRLKIKDPLAGGPGRVSKLAEIEANAVDFANQIMLDLDIPSCPDLVLGRLRGFEDVDVDFKDVTGVITIHASFKTLSGFKLRMELLIPICRGEFHRPSIAKINGKKHIFCQALIDTLVAKHETVRPKLMNPLSPNRVFLHEETIERGLFETTKEDSNYFDLIRDRY